MDLKTLKLELLERIALLEDEARLLALKRLLDGPPTYTVPSDHLSVVREGDTPYLKLEDRMYTAEEVRKVVEEVLREVEADQ
jgi:HD superfamily phosphodiesterase